MKKLITAAFILSCAFQTTAQEKTNRVQCAGKTKAGERCKLQINPKNPKAAVMDAGGVYYCYFHIKQAKK